MNQEYLKQITDAECNIAIDKYVEEQSYQQYTEMPESEIARMVEEERQYNEAIKHDRIE